MRIALAGINHETNTYCKSPTTADAFYQYRGERMLKMAGTETSTGGALIGVANSGSNLYQYCSRVRSRRARLSSQHMINLRPKY